MSYCQSGEIATVNYSFAGIPKEFATDQTPIDVITTQLLPNGQCQGLPYRVVFYFRHNANATGRYGTTGYSGGRPFTSNPIYGAISNIRFGVITGSQVYLDVLCYGTASPRYNIGCWRRDPITQQPVWVRPSSLQTSQTQFFTGIEIIDIVTDTQTAQGFNLCVKYDYTQNCGALIRLDVKSNGIVIFSDQGKSPCIFDVVCKSLQEECPPGTCECICADDGLICCYDGRGIAIKSFYR